MKTWITLLRGVNVGGRNPLPMRSLRQIIASAGGRRVATYIQSGNAVFLASIPSRETFGSNLASAIEIEHGFRPAVLLLTAEELATAIAENPFREAVSEPTTLHLYLLDDRPDASKLESVAKLASSTESFRVVERRLYLHAPDGIAHSKFARALDRALQTHTTARNWRTVGKIAELADTIDQRSNANGI